MRAWWQSWPRLLEYELAELRAAGFAPVVNEKKHAEHGVIEMKLQVPYGSATVALRAIYPDSYPYLRCEVFADDLRLPHHQNPFGKNLCLLGRSTRWWTTGDTLARLMQDQFPKVLGSAGTPDAQTVAALEEHQAEPASAYYEYLLDGMILVDGGWSLPLDITSGRMIIGLSAPASVTLRGAVLELRGDRNQVLAVAPPGWKELYPIRVEGRWMRVHDAPTGPQGWRVLQSVAANGGFKNLVRTKLAEGEVAPVGVLLPEEVAWRREAEGWLFAADIRVIKRGFRPKSVAACIRAGRAGRGDLTKRVPETSMLCNKTIALFGLGCIGAPSALEFARAIVGKLRVLDADIVDPGTAVRWPFGLKFAGMRKVDAVQKFLAEHYPYTKVEKWHHRIGGVQEEHSDTDVLNAMLPGADLIFDATAELGVQQFLAAQAREANIPYVSISTTNGAWGGRVMLLRPGKTAGCWVCLQHALAEETIPPAPDAPTEFVQPEGCMSPTFTGANFDVMEVALMGVRSAIGTLLEGTAGSYPSPNWDVAILRVRERADMISVPRWTTHTLNRHPACPAH